MVNKSTHHSPWKYEDIISYALFLFSPVMRILGFVFLLLFVSSCKTDVVVPCGANEVLAGRLCSEFRSLNGTPSGTVEYSYSDNGNTVITDFVDPNGKELKTIRYTYKDGLILTQRETEEGLEKAISFSYNDQDSISSIAYFTGVEIDSIVYCDFENGNRIKVRVQDGTQILRFEDYRYDSDGTLNRVSYFSADSTLLRYRQFKFFGTERILIKNRTPDHQLIYSDNLELDSDGHLIQNIRRSATLDTILVITNKYGDLGKLVEKTEESSAGITAIRYYYYE